MHQPFIPYEYMREVVAAALTRWGARRLLRRAITRGWIDAEQADQILFERDCIKADARKLRKKARQWRPGK